MLLQIQINFKPQLHAVFKLYIAGVGTNIFTWMWDEKQLRESYFSFVSNTCVICTRIKLLGLQCSSPFQFALHKIGSRVRDIL